MNDNDKLIKLALPFNDDQIRYRVGATSKDKKKGLALAYIDKRDVENRLDDTLGMGGWQTKHTDAGDGRLCCSIGIKVGDEWVWKSDGAGGREASKGLSSHDANKGDFADSFKRAASAWGIGRYLYDMKNQWVQINQYKQIEDSMRPILDRAHKMLCEGKMPEPIPQETPRRSKADSRDDYKLAQSDIDDAPDMSALIEVWKEHWPSIQTMHVDFEDQITQRKDDRKHELKKAMEAA